MTLLAGSSAQSGSPCRTEGKQVYPIADRGQPDMLEVTEFLKSKDFPRTTRRTYSAALRVVLSAFQGRDLATVTREDFAALTAARRWKPATAKLAHMALRSYLRYLGAEDSLPFRWKIGRSTTAPQRALEPADKARLLAACNRGRSGQQLAVIIEVLWGTWLRASELCGARLDQLDLERGTLVVLGKGGKYRSVALTTGVASLLEAWIRIERPYLRGARTCPNVFVTYWGKPWTRESLRTMLRRLGERAGVPVSPHDFRRGACTEALRRGVSTRLAQVQGGWSSVTMVEKYSATLGVDDARAALERIA